jgi:hypothetical protein
MTRQAYRFRRLRRHLILAAASGAALAIFWAVFPERGAMARLTMGSAYAGLALLGGSLGFGPLKVT